MSLQQPEAGYVSLTHNPPPLPAVTDSEAKFGNRVSVTPPTLLLSDSIFSFLSPLFLSVTPYLSAAPFVGICSDYILYEPLIPYPQYTYIPFLAGI